MPTPPADRRVRRQARPSFLENLFDPERERPFLKMLWQRFGPLLLEFLTNKLPHLLVQQRPDPEKEETLA